MSYARLNRILTRLVCVAGSLAWCGLSVSGATQAPGGAVPPVIVRSGVSRARAIAAKSRYRFHLQRNVGLYGPTVARPDVLRPIFYHRDFGLTLWTGEPLESRI